MILLILNNIMDECNRIEANLNEANNAANNYANTITTVAAAKVNIKVVQQSIETLIYQITSNCIANT